MSGGGNATSGPADDDTEASSVASAMVRSSGHGSPSAMPMARPSLTHGLADRRRRLRWRRARRCSGERRCCGAGLMQHPAAVPLASRGRDRRPAPANGSRHCATSNHSPAECLMARLSPASWAASAARLRPGHQRQVVEAGAGVALDPQAAQSSETVLQQRPGTHQVAGVLDGLTEVDERLGVSESVREAAVAAPAPARVTPRLRTDHRAAPPARPGC